MTRGTHLGKPAAAMLRNVQALLTAIEYLRNRKDHIDGMGCVFGPSGYGKTIACATAAAHLGAVHVEALPSWGKRELVDAVARAFGIAPAKRIPATVELIGDYMLEFQPTLILDEADIIVKAGAVEYARAFYMASKAPVILVGENHLPGKLREYAPLYGRIPPAGWVPFNPLGLADARQLATMHADGIEIADDLLALVVSERRGVCRTIVSNIDQIAGVAEAEGVTTATREWWGDRRLDLGEAPVRRL